jgi:hypothetical protein
MRIFIILLFTKYYRVIKLRRIIWAEHVARMGTVRNVYIIWLGNLKGREYSEDLDVDRNIILEWVLGK